MLSNTLVKVLWVHPTIIRIRLPYDENTYSSCLRIPTCGYTRYVVRNVHFHRNSRGCIIGTPGKPSNAFIERNVLDDRTTPEEDCSLMRLRISTACRFHLLSESFTIAEKSEDGSARSSCGVPYSRTSPASRTRILEIWTIWSRK